jgi:pterin-4a-carbinolamine dehydratase
MDEVAAIQAIALKAVINEEPAFLFRRVLRWYSTTFHTPLHVAEDLPLDYVLGHFFEYSIDLMSAQARNKLADEISGKSDKDSDDAFLAKTKEQAKAERQKAKKKKEKAEKIVKEAEGKDFLDAAAVEQVIRQAAAKLGDLPDLSMKFDPNLDTEDVLSSNPRD